MVVIVKVDGQGRGRRIVESWSPHWKRGDEEGVMVAPLVQGLEGKAEMVDGGERVEQKLPGKRGVERGWCNLPEGREKGREGREEESMS